MSATVTTPVPATPAPATPADRRAVLAGGLDTQLVAYQSAVHLSGLPDSPASDDREVPGTVEFMATIGALMSSSS